MGKGERAKNQRATLLRLWRYLRRQRLALIVTVLMVIITTGLNLLGPYLMGVAIDQYIIPGDLAGLIRIALLMLATYGIASLLTWAQSYVMAGASQRTVRDLRADLFRKLQTLDLRFFDQRAHGDLMSRLTNDIENVNAVLSESIVQLVSGALSLVTVAIVMIWLNPGLAAVTLVTIPSLMILLSRWITSHTSEGFRRQQAQLGSLNGLIEETVTGQRVVVAYSREQTVLEQFATSNQALRQAATHAQVYAGFMGPTMNFVNNIGLALVAAVGGWMALQGMATIGTIASFINYARQFGRPLNEIANLFNVIQSAVAGAERVFAILDEEPRLQDAPDAKSLERIDGDVVFDDVSFSYETGTPILQHISFHAQPGQIVALVGPTGAGKTTIVNLLTRFYDIDSGQIRIDGQDISTLKLDDLRRQVGIVLQDTFLFAGSVMDNIRYGRLEATDEEVKAAATLANADTFIHRLPQGYDTLLSERANNLSQGQRQLLAIARAILADPSILILDEATSSVDTRTEQHIQEAMLRLMTGRTSFVIAHRLSTIRNADQILVINHGEAIERGTHQELLAQKGFYHQLYTSQFRANGRSNGAVVPAVAVE
ncbi:MAG: ABC transporter ATP-binding protein [Caldilineaceae bacterium]|nr:ABC transporter ATP-binding protein [Caldilineaceae bacterium]